MKTANAFDRRRFLQTSLLGSTALAAAVTALPGLVRADVTKPERDAFDGLKLGIASYTYRKFSLEAALAMTKEAGLKYINLKDMHLPLKSTTEQRQAVRKQVEDAGLTLMGGGVIALGKEEADIRAKFDYVKDAGMPVMVCTLDPESMDLVEKVAKDYEIRLAIHNHGPGDKHFPSPHDVFAAVKDRDKRLGLCMDIGHTVRIGQDPADAAIKCASRLYDLHLKDETLAKPAGKPTEVGRGVIDIVGLFKALLQIKYSGHAGLEYEAKEAAPQPGVLESVAYMRGVLAALG